MYRLVYTKLVSYTKLVWCSMMNTYLCKHVLDDVHAVVNELL
jgi:hypothetical protein